MNRTSSLASRKAPPRPATTGEMALYNEYGPLNEQLPIEFSNGLKISNLQVSCCECGAQVPADHVHGVIGRFGEHLAVVRIAGQCDVCDVVNLGIYRFHDDGSIDYRVDSGWKSARVGSLEIQRTIKALVRELRASILCGAIGLLVPWTGAILFVASILALLVLFHDIK